MRAVVLGGGLAGLAAAWGLRRAGAHTILFESAPHTGGRSAGFRDRGYAFDLLPRPLPAADPDIHRLCEAWSGQLLVKQRRMARMLHEGRSWRFPPDARDLLGPQGPGLAAAAVAGFLQVKLGSGRTPPADFLAFTSARVGLPLCERFFGPYVEKLTGLPAGELSADLARGFLPRWGLLRQMVRRAFDREGAWEEILSPEGGLMTIAEGLTHALERAGAEVLSGHRVTCLRKGAGGRIGEVLAEGPSGTVRCVPDLVISTLPAAALLHVLEGFDLQAAAEALARIRHRSAILVFLGVRRDGLGPDHHLFVPEQGIRFHRLTETINYAPRMAPRGATGLCAEIACHRNDSVWSEADAAQVRRVIEDLCYLGFLRSTGEVEAAWVRRLPDADPIETLDHAEQVRAIQRCLAAIGNLKTCGRQGLFREAGPARSIRAGLDAAAEAAGEAVRAA